MLAGCGPYLQIYPSSQATDAGGNQLRGIPVMVCALPADGVSNEFVINTTKTARLDKNGQPILYPNGKKVFDVIEEKVCKSEVVYVNVRAIPFIGGKLHLRLYDGRLIELDTTRESQSGFLEELTKAAVSGAAAGRAARPNSE